MQECYDNGAHADLGCGECRLYLGDGRGDLGQCNKKMSPIEVHTEYVGARVTCKQRKVPHFVDYHTHNCLKCSMYWVGIVALTEA